jgi:TolB-like protein
MKTKKIITSLIIFLSCNVLFTERGLESATTSEKIIIYYYENKSGLDNFGYYSYVIPGTITRELKKAMQYNVETVPVALPYIDKSASKSVLENHLRSLADKGKKLSAEYIITGAYYIKEKKIHIQTQIFDVKTQNMASVSESSPELGSLLINILDKVTLRINDELGKFKERRNRFDYITSKKKLYGILSLSFAQLAIISLGAGYYSHYEMERAESRYDTLAYNYSIEIDPIVKEQIQRDMEHELDTADENKLYRDISYGIGAASLLTTIFCTYKYLAYRSTENKLRTERGGSFLLTPLYSYGTFGTIPVSTCRGEQFIGVMMSWRF